MQEEIEEFVSKHLQYYAKLKKLLLPYHVE